MSENEEIVTLVNDEEAAQDLVHSNPLALETTTDLEDELAKFRNQWKRELTSETKRPPSPSTAASSSSSVSVTGKNVAQYHEFPRKRQPKISEASASSPDPANEAAKARNERDLDYDEPTGIEEKAKYLFNKAVLLEQQSRHYEAIKFYRLAMQLDADIEFKVASQRSSKNTTKASSSQTNSSVQAKQQTALNSEDEQDTSQGGDDLEGNNQEKEGGEGEEEETDNSIMSLYEQFQTFSLSEAKFCQMNYTQKATHFSQLPVEVIILVLKWVVSDQLDLRSLEMCAAVCKGFYVCARDPEIWKLVCAKIWGDKNINNFLPTYSDWRSMFLRRPRLNFDGVYISKASYARAGQQSLDNLYRPWHLVEYYRYLRFFSNGTVLFLTTPDEPKNVVSKLKVNSSTSIAPGAAATTAQTISSASHPFVLNEHSVLRGTWTLALDKVSIVAYKKIVKQDMNAPSGGRKHGRKQANLMEQEHIFRMELDLSSGERRLNNQLSWATYEIHVSNKSTNYLNISRFDLNKIDFPNFYFSRVKSYSQLSSAPLK